MRHLPPSTRLRVASRRAGSLIPAMALALLVVLGGTALVVDRLALDTARSELRTSAEAAALAAARELASDDRLREDFEPAALRMKARFAAARIASENFVAGETLTLNTDPLGDVRFVRLVIDPEIGDTIFDEAIDSNDDPTTVAVFARRTNDRDAPVALPFRGFYAPTEANVVAVAEASIDFRVIGFRPIDELSIPTLPIAILSESISDSNKLANEPGQKKESKSESEKKPQSLKVASWMSDIERRRGFDRFRYDNSTGEVIASADGIPEIVLRTAARPGDPKANAFVLALTGDITQESLRRQICEGWSVDDLQPLGGELLLDRDPLILAGLRGVDCNTLANALRKVIGQSRILLLYDREIGDLQASVASLQIRGMVAGRVMSIREISECECEIVIQPAVMATRSAVTMPGVQVNGYEENKYVANLRLTN